MSNTNSRAIEVSEPKLRQLLAGQMKRMEALLSSEIRPEQMCALVMESFRKNPDLALCSPDSILYSVLQACTANLKIGGPFPEAHLVPYKGECTLIPDWRGCIKVVTRSGYVTKVQPRSVWTEDLEFDILYGTEDKIIHRPTLDAEKGTISHVYAVFYLATGESKFDVMTTPEVERIRAAAPGKNSPAWTNHWEQQAWKTVIKRGAKTIPIPDEDRRAMDADTIRIPTDDDRPAKAEARVVNAKSSARTVPNEQPAQEDNGERRELVMKLAGLQCDYPDAYAKIMDNAPDVSDMRVFDIKKSIGWIEEELAEAAAAEGGGQ